MSHLEEPELLHMESSEIEAVCDTTSLGPLGDGRPIMINQSGEEFLNLTMSDARRLHKFLGEALEYLASHEGRTIQ